MSFTNDQKKALGGADYNKSSKDANTYINGNHSVKSRGGTIIFNTDRHTTNPGTMSNTDFKKKLK